MTTTLMELKGVNGKLELFEDKIIIRRQGLISFLTQGFKGDKTIYLSQITGIQLKKANSLVNGYIQFTLPGGNENTGGTYGASCDENTVLFAPKDNDLAYKIQLEIENLKRNLQQAGASYYKSDDPDIIRKYKQLYDEGILTKEEFETKKKEILGF